MNTSINEVAALARKAARGAGYSWSMADEAAFATAWLCRNGLNGAVLLAEHLNLTHEHGIQESKLQSLELPWRGGPVGLCALSAGATLSDLAQCEHQQSETLNQIITPELLLPFLAYVSQRAQKKLNDDSLCIKTLIVCERFEAHIHCMNGVAGLNKFSATSATTAASSGKRSQFCDLNYQYQFTSHTPQKVREVSVSHRINIPANELESLNRFAANTYAPATEASRQGAGAGNTDND